MGRRLKILMTGGHVTPALAVIDRIKTRNIPLDIAFVGRKHARADHLESFEYQEVTKRGIPFTHLEAGRLTRIFSISSVMNALKIPAGFMSAWQILTSENPDIVLSFGGYLALPIAYAAQFNKIPLFTHEQTIHPGLANRMIARVAKNIFISFPESAAFFPEGKAIFTGNPLRKSIFNVQKKLDIPKGVPVIYVTGGSLGSHAVNEHMEHILPLLLKQAVVIHQTGNSREFGDYDRLLSFREALRNDLKERYIIQSHVSDDEIGAIYSAADMIVGRSGANTFFEAIALQKPAVFIPLPYAAYDEQRKHARLFDKNGAGKLVEQTESSEQVLQAILEVLTNKAKYKAQMHKLSHYYQEHAADQIIDAILHH